MQLSDPPQDAMEDATAGLLRLGVDGDRVPHRAFCATINRPTYWVLRGEHANDWVARSRERSHPCSVSRQFGAAPAWPVAVTLATDIGDVRTALGAV